MESRLAALVLGLSLLSVAPQSADFDLAIRHGRVVHGDGRVTARATIFVSAGRISRIDDASSADGVSARREIEAAGRWVIPGLLDANVHVEPWSGPLFPKYGVTSVRDLHNAPDMILGMARDDSPLGPRIVAAGATIDGPGSFWPGAVVVSDITSVRAAVRRQVEAGAAAISVSEQLTASIIAAVAQEARARGVPVAARLGRATAIEAAVAGVTSIEELSGISAAAGADREQLLKPRERFERWTVSELEWLRLQPAALDQVTRTMVERGVTLVPALVLHEAWSRLADADLLRDPALADVPPEIMRTWAPDDLMARGHWTPATMADFKRVLPRLQRFVGAYVKAGGRVAAGTGTPRDFVAPGSSLHRELELYVACGLTPAQALRSATADAADLLGIASRAGAIQVGKDADLVVLAADPLTDIRATRRIVAVVRSGVVVRR